MKRLAAVVALSLGLAHTCFAAPLEIGALHFPPYYLVENGSTVTGGYLTYYIKKIFATAGLDYVFKGYPPKRLYLNVGNGTTQIWLGTIGVPEYEGKTLVSKKILAINLEVYSAGPAETLPKTLDDLKGKSVITIRGYAYGGMIFALQDPKNNIKLEIANSHATGFEMLRVGRADFLFDYIEPATETLANMNFPNVNKRSWKAIDIYFHVSKSLPDAQAIMDKLMKAHDALTDEGYSITGSKVLLDSNDE